jgi:hypothetical protein
VSEGLGWPTSRPTHATGSATAWSSSRPCEELSRLPPRWQVVIVNSQVWKQADVAEILDVNPARISYLLRRVSERLNEMARERHELERPVASPRAARLRELEDNPSKWLTEVIGRAPTRNKTGGPAVLAWRRAALDRRLSTRPRLARAGRRSPPTTTRSCGASGVRACTGRRLAGA